ncbi:unnamed protein product, partial [Mesorhabditis spiculigera]
MDKSGKAKAGGGGKHSIPADNRNSYPTAHKKQGTGGGGGYPKPGYGSVGSDGYPDHAVTSSKVSTEWWREKEHTKYLKKRRFTEALSIQPNRESFWLVLLGILFVSYITG